MTISYHPPMLLSFVNIFRSMTSIDYCFIIINYSVNKCNGDARAMLESWGRGNLQIISIAVIKLIQCHDKFLDVFMCLRHGYVN